MLAANITLLPHTLQHVRALREGSDAYERRFDVSVAEGVEVEKLKDVKQNLRSVIQPACSQKLSELPLASVRQWDGLVF